MRYEVILDSGETVNKCTIAPLAGRPDFRIHRVKGPLDLGPLSAALLLHPDGECLTQLKASVPPASGIAAIDCVWRRVEVLLRRIAGPLPRLARIPQGFVTAYPRHSRFGFDPEAGLATIEAIFVARALLGQWDPTLLSAYYFGRKFVELNRWRFLELGVTEAGLESSMPVLAPRIRSSQQRRRDRKELKL